MPSLTRSRPCKTCDKITEQTLTATRSGAAWKCCVCTQSTDVYTLDNMRDMLRQHTAPPRGRGPEIDPSKVRIYMEHPEGEFELSAHSVRKHLEITGAVPKVGDPVFTRSDDAGSVTGLGLEVPYGRVRRVEITE